jgi:hypothetical protein
MKNIIKCPNCGVPSYKYVGCEMMTCPVCHTNYHYSTGEITQYGNPHNKDVVLTDNKKLSSLYRKELSEKEGLLNLVLEIERKKRKEYDPNIIINLLSNLRWGEDLNIIYDLAKEYERRNKMNRKYKEYNNAIVEIDELITSSEINEEKLSNILERL